MLVASYLPLCYNLIRINWEREKMLSAIYPVPASEVRLPFYLLGIGRTSPEFHVKRDKGLTSHQFLYTAKGCGILEVGNRKYKLEKNSFMYLPRNGRNGRRPYRIQKNIRQNIQSCGG